MKKGINQWCYPPGTPLTDVLTWTKEAGFDAIELNVSKPGDVGLNLETTLEEAKEIKAKVTEAGLAIESLSTALLWEFPLSAGEEKVREQGKNVVRKMLELANAMELDAILVVPGLVTSEVAYDECYRRSLDSIKELAPYAEELGVKIGIENVWNQFLLSPLEMVAFIDGCDSEFVGAYFDVGNVLQFGFPEQWIRILGNRIVKVHVKDFNKKVGNITGFTNLLAGDVNWPAVMHELNEINYTGAISAELSAYANHPAALAHDTARHMDILLSMGQESTANRWNCAVIKNRGFPSE
ncbi:sugar phosphate isomerase/epimerase family protein [Shouchella shacheensis]|uniref:sugar phosphate isomerase/epimerase family protein n=1 Tax=Shouchella shacheensis TaxID=1649580 RepID=UPI00074005FF|nr:sugar phosphate isomerase/epimerase family protein [Shouchella shacheensis]